MLPKGKSSSSPRLILDKGLDGDIPMAMNAVRLPANRQAAGIDPAPGPAPF
jgi:hypothetical protein